MEYLDLHSHVLRETFEENYDEILKETLSNKGSRIVNISLDLNSSIENIELAKKYPGNVKVAIGVHPTSDLSSIKSDIVKLEKLYIDNKDNVIAIGEIGFNRYTDEDRIEEQTEAFQLQLDLAVKLELPIIIHSRNADKEVFDFLSKQDKLPTFILHSWTGKMEWSKKLLDLGAIISYSGIVTFKNAKEVQEVLDITPVDRLFYETDCPWLAPTPMRGKLNKPEYSKYVGQFIADRKNITFEELNEIIKDNFNRVFKNGEWLNESK